MTTPPLSSTHGDVMMAFIRCPLCSQGYGEAGGHRPFMIPCGHTFCEICIKNLTQVNQMGAYIKCPECPKNPPHEIKQLALNLAVLDIVTQVSRGILVHFGDGRGDK